MKSVFLACLQAICLCVVVSFFVFNLETVKIERIVGGFCPASGATSKCSGSSDTICSGNVNCSEKFSECYGDGEKICSQSSTNVCSGANCNSRTACTCSG